MKPFRFLFLSALAISLLIACEPKTDLVTPQTNSARTSASDAAAIFAETYNVSLTADKKYDDGVTPAVAMNSDGFVVEVHKSQNTNYLYYRAGYGQSDGTINWDKSRKIPDVLSAGFLGKDPSIAIYGDRVVVVATYEGLFDTGAVAYIVGEVDYNDFTIKWGSVKIFPTGSGPVYMGNKPTVAIRGLEVVFVFEDAKSNALMYALGHLNTGKDMKILTSPKAFDRGKDPTVAVNKQGQIVEMHKSPESNTLWVVLGQLDTQSVKWVSDDVQYTTGIQPSVSIDYNGSVVEVHKSEAENKVFRVVGYLMDNRFHSTSNTKLGSGAFPSIAINNFASPRSILAVDDGSKHLLYKAQ